MGRSISVIVPAYNEEGALAGVVAQMMAAAAEGGVEAEIVIVDDGSTDGTGAIAAAEAARDTRVRVVRHAENRGLGAALQTGFHAARGEFVSWLPADGQFDARDTVRLLDALGDADIVVADVRAADRIAGDSLFKLVLSKGLRLVMRILAGGLVTYTGLLLFRRAIVDGVQLSSTTGVANFELIHRAVRRGGVVRRAPFAVAVRARHAGESKVANTRTIVRHLVEVGRLRHVR